MLTTRRTPPPVLSEAAGVALRERGRVEGPPLALAIVIAGAISIAVAIARMTTPVITTIDNEVTGYGTFQSHNQKVVETADGIFMTYAKTPFTTPFTRCARSTAA